MATAIQRDIVALALVSEASDYLITGEYLGKV